MKITCPCGKEFTPKPGKEAREDWERRIDEELYFLTQDGYAGKWAEMKKEDIKNIIRFLMSSLQQKIESLEKSTCKEGHALPTRYCDSCSETRANNLVLKDVLALFKKNI